MTESEATNPKRPPDRLILLGRILGAFGVRGEVKVESHTDPAAALLKYQPWQLRDPRGNVRTVEGAKGRSTAKGVTTTLPGVEDRDAADALRGTEIWVPRSALPPAKPGEYYWVDLEGLEVVTVEGIRFGRVVQVFPTGSNDVLVVQGERERMIPFLQQDVVTAVDLDAGTLTVDWDPDF